MCGRVIEKMNRKAATVENDIPIKLFHEFSVELSFPLSHILNFCIKNGVYPDIWKVETVTSGPKIYPPGKLEDLRIISELPNFSKGAVKMLH